MSALAREINATFSGRATRLGPQPFDISLLNSVRRSPSLPSTPFIRRFSHCLAHYPGEHFGRYRREIYLDPFPPSCFILAKKGWANIETTFGKYRVRVIFLIEEKCFCFRCDMLELFRSLRVRVRTCVHARDVSLLVRRLPRWWWWNRTFGRNGKGWRARDRARSEINFQ